jgi:crossover junction endodeoxyribonuclease RuvC
VDTPALSSASSGFEAEPEPTATEALATPLATPPAIRILGIDPGLANTGWGIVESVNHSERALAYGCIITGPEISRSERLQRIHDELSTVIRRYQPTEMAVENVYFGTNAKSALSIGEVRGVAILAAARQGLSVDDYSVTQIKQTVVGEGRAEKAQIQFMIKALLKLDHQPQPDHAADALAAALCHARMRRIR